MKLSSWLSLLTGTCLLSAGACSKKADVKSNVADLERSLNAPAQPATQPQPNAPTPAAVAEANALLKSAVVAVQANDYAHGVIALQAAQQKPGMTADQIATAQ